MSSGPIFTYADGSLLYKIGAKALITKFHVWESNRTMDDDHVRALETAISSPTEIQGPFSVITYTDEENKIQNRIIDGQHRQEVLKRYFDRNQAATDFEVLVRRYQIKDHESAIKIFQQINHAKPMIYKGSSTERLQEFVSVLKRRLVSESSSGKIIQCVRPNCNRPFLSIETLTEMIKLYGIHELTELTSDEFVKHAEHMNAFYAEDINRINARFTQTTLDRAIEHGFYLGLDPKCSWLLPLRSH